MNVLPIWKVSTQEIESAPLEETKEMALEHQETVSLETSVCMKVYNELLPTVTFEHTCRHTTVTRVPIQDSQRCLDFIPLILIYQKNCYFVSTPGRFVALRIWDAGHNTAFSPFFSAVTVLKREKFVLLRVIPQCHARTALILASGTVHSEAALLLCLALTGYCRPRRMGFSLPVPKASLDSLRVRRPAQPLPTRHCR